MPSVHSLNVSLGGVPKLPVSQVKVSLNGLEGDSHNDLKHHGGLSRAVCLYSLELIDDLKLEGHNIYPGSTGENITIKGLDWNELESGLKLKIGGVVIILTDPATPCKTISYSFSSDDDDDTTPPKCTRTGGKNIEFLHGFKTKKWITTISMSEKKMVFEEWFVDTLPLKFLSDSLEFEIKSTFNPNKEMIESDEFEFSSNIFIIGLDSLTLLEPIPGHAVKINFLIFDDDDDPSMTASFEILELYAEPVDTGYYVIPENYEKTEMD